LAAVLLAFGVTYTARNHGRGTTYPGHSVFLATAFVLGGISLVGAGLAIRRHRPQLCSLAVVAATLWLAGPLAGWQSGPPLIRTIGMLAGNLVFPTVALLVLVAAFGALTAVLRHLMAALFVTVTVASAVLVLFGDPFLDPYCWANCTTSPFVVAPLPDLAQSVDQVRTWVISTAAVCLGAVCLVGLLDREPLRLWEVLPGGLLFSAATAAHGFLLWRQPFESPATTGYRAVFVAESIALTLISSGLLALLLDTARRRRRVGQIVKDLSETPPTGELDQALGRILGDHGLRISYWLPGAGYFADAHGKRMPEPSSAGSSVATPLVRDGNTIAVITHHTDPAELERSLGPAIRLALDNERLQAEIRARVRELGESRARIVETGDARRQQLERDLHDGVQQSLLAMSADLERARTEATDWGDDEALVLIDHAVSDTRESFRELRELAHGIYPSVLDAAGLCAALASLVDNERLAVQVDCRLGERLPRAIEAACYVLAITTIEAAATSSATRVLISVFSLSDTIVVRIEHDGPDNTFEMQHLADRVGAAGGLLKLSPQSVEAEFPCV
jgi:signal transduction histidine kinase